MAPGVGLAWTPGQHLVTATADEPSFEVASWDPPPPFRKLFFQGHLQFMAHAPALERSRLLRAALIDCLKELDDPESAHARDLRAALTVWSFMEAVYLVDPALDSSHVSARLADWFAMNFGGLLEQARDVLRTDVDPVDEDEEDQFWSLVSRLAAVGSRSTAQRLVSARIARGGFDKGWAAAAGAAALRASDEDATAGHAPLAVAESMLAECPAESDSSSAARTDASWVRWQDTCDAWADVQERDQERRLTILLKVLAGSVVHIATACQSWEEMLVATATYARRVLTDSRNDHGIVEVENACAEAAAVHTPPDHIAGGALVDAALGQPAEAIVRLGASLGTTWYAAHLCDLMMQANRLGPDAASRWMPAPGDVSLLEYLVLEFASKLERNRGMWRITADYYTQCPRRGRQRLRDMLGRVSTNGPVDPVVEKVITFCKSNGLPDVTKTICARVGAQCAHARNYGGAVFWFSRGGLLDRAVSVVEAAISDAEVCGPVSPSARVLSQAVAAASVAAASDAVQERIAYALAYVQFQGEIAVVLGRSGPQDTDGTAGGGGAGEADDDARFVAVKRAERLAVRLVCGGGLPRRFWPNVVYEVCNVLDKHPACAAVVATDSLYELLSALEIVSSVGRHADSFQGLSRRLESQHGDRMRADDDGAGGGEGRWTVDDALQQMRTTLLQAITVSFSSAFA
jgi:hypothetical protein